VPGAAAVAAAAVRIALSAGPGIEHVRLHVIVVCPTKLVPWTAASAAQVV
jgi:hypothetical protein